MNCKMFLYICVDIYIYIEKYVKLKNIDLLY